jgi:hypothetical protein
MIDINLVMTILLVGFFVVVFGGIILWVILMYLKGNLKITTSKDTYSFGEQIHGVLTVTAKKDIEVNKVIVSLICMERRPGKNQTDEELYRNDNIIDSSSHMSKGSSRTYNFDIATPMKNIEKENLHNYRREWFLEIRVDAKGVDLLGAKDIKFFDTPAKISF